MGELADADLSCKSRGYTLQVSIQLAAQPEGLAEQPGSTLQVSDQLAAQPEGLATQPEGHNPSKQPLCQHAVWLLGVVCQHAVWLLGASMLLDSLDFCFQGPEP